MNDPSEPVTAEAPPGDKVSLTVGTGSPVALSATIPAMLPDVSSSVYFSPHEKRASINADIKNTFFIIQYSIGVI